MAAEKFITLEGGEGCGKSTQAGMLAERIRAELDAEAILTREPGGSPFAEKIRDLILSEPPAVRETEFLLFAAARAEHVGARIAPALNAGHWVVCDRFIDSTRVYQGILAGIDRELVFQLEQKTVRPYMPALTFILDVPVDVAMARASERGALTRYDAAAADQHQRLRDSFLSIANAEPERCVIIDGSRPTQQVADEIWQTLTSRLLAGAT